MISTLFVVFAVASSALGFCPFTPFIPSADIGAISGRWYVTQPNLGDSPQNFTHISMDFIPRVDGNFNLTISGTNPDGSKKREYWSAERTAFSRQLNINDFSKKTPYKVNFNVMVTDNYVGYLNGYFCLILPTRSFPIYGGNFSRTDPMNGYKNVELTDLID